MIGGRVNWAFAAMYGALGGGVIEAVVFYGRLSAWQSARHRALARNSRHLPRIQKYIDPLSDTLAALTRLGLGAIAGALFHWQITGAYAAIAVGASAPALLLQFGAARSVHDAIQGSAAAPSDTIPGNPVRQ
jgi:hypothetical protein